MKTPLLPLAIIGVGAYFYLNRNQEQTQTFSGGGSGGGFITLPGSESPAFSDGSFLTGSGLTEATPNVYNITPPTNEGFNLGDFLSFGGTDTTPQNTTPTLTAGSDIKNSEGFKALFEPFYLIKKGLNLFSGADNSNSLPQSSLANVNFLDRINAPVSSAFPGIPETKMRSKSSDEEVKISTGQITSPSLTGFAVLPSVSNEIRSAQTSSQNVRSGGGNNYPQSSTKNVTAPANTFIKQLNAPVRSPFNSGVIYKGGLGFSHF